MSLLNFIATIESEWEPEAGFFWQIRQGHFHQDAFARAFAKIAAVPSVSEHSTIPSRLVSVLWYVPVFMHWQADRVQEQGGDVQQYCIAMNKMTAEIERILGVP